MRVSVLLPLALDQSYDYLAPDDVAVGQFIRVPLRKKEMVGVVWARSGGDALPPRQLRRAIAVQDVPPLNQALRDFIDWVADYTMAPKGMVLKLAFAPPSLFDGVATAAPSFWVAAEILPPDFRLTPARRQVLAAATTPQPAAQLAVAASASVVRGLIKAGALVKATPPAASTAVRPPPEFSTDQKKSMATIRAAIAQNQFQSLLLDGVTGSGKTEICFDAAVAAIEKGRQTLFLLPEIALTNYMLERFQQYNDAAAAIWHSGLGAAARRRLWLDIANGKIKMVIGARSALFLPFRDLGLVIVDEEHDEGFKQEEGVIYHARDMAIVRASLGGFPIILSSATPCLETLTNVARDRYARLSLPKRVLPRAQPPKIHLIDLRAQKQKKKQWIAPLLVDAIRDRLKKNEQTLLFLNRRGYAPLTLCRNCGFRFTCSDCDSWLAQHRNGQRLLCHHCGSFEMLPERCPTCHQAGSLAPCGPGVERIFEEARSFFPTARIACLSRDLPQKIEERRTVFEDMRQHRLDILIGTQIVAKSFHFPRLTLAGIIDADLGLANADLRAGERSFQLLQQVAGRTGRDALPGEAFLQTYMPDHPVMQALLKNDRDAFIAQETKMRQKGGWPPYGRLAAIILSGEERHLLQTYAKNFATAAPKGKVQVFGPAPAPIFRRKRRYRIRFLLKAARDVSLQHYLRAWLSLAPSLPHGMRRQIDLDPHSFL